MLYEYTELLCTLTVQNICFFLEQKIRTALQKSKSASELLAPLKALGFCLRLISDSDWLSTQGRELVRREIIEGILARPPADDYDEDACDTTAWQHSPEARSKVVLFRHLSICALIVVLNTLCTSTAFSYINSFWTMRRLLVQCCSCL